MDADALLALVDAAIPGEGLSTDDLLGVCFDDDLGPCTVFGDDVGAASVAVRDGIGAVQLLAVHPDARREGRGRRLLDDATAWAFDNGAAVLTIGAAPPWYLWPGIDLRWTAGLVLAESAGFTDRGAALNLSCPTTVRSPEPGGVTIRRVPRRLRRRVRRPARLRRPLGEPRRVVRPDRCRPRAPARRHRRPAARRLPAGPQGRRLRAVRDQLDRPGRVLRQGRRGRDRPRVPSHRKEEALMAGAFWFSAIVVGLAYAATLVCVADAMRIPLERWAAAEQSRRAWIAFMLVLPIVFVPYWFSIRPQLRRALQP
jgi:GNAT superfamily N-acetyltransferase